MAHGRKGMTHTSTKLQIIYHCLLNPKQYIAPQLLGSMNSSGSKYSSWCLYISFEVVESNERFAKVLAGC